MQTTFYSAVPYQTNRENIIYLRNYQTSALDSDFHRKNDDFQQKHQQRVENRKKKADTVSWVAELCASTGVLIMTGLLAFHIML